MKIETASINKLIDIFSGLIATMQPIHKQSDNKS